MKSSVKRARALLLIVYQDVSHIGMVLDSENLTAISVVLIDSIMELLLIPKQTFDVDTNPQGFDRNEIFCFLVQNIRPEVKRRKFFEILEKAQALAKIPKQAVAAPKIPAKLMN